MLAIARKPNYCETCCTAGCSETDLVSLFVMLAYSLRGPLSCEHAL